MSRSFVGSLLRGCLTFASAGSLVVAAGGATAYAVASGNGNAAGASAGNSGSAPGHTRTSGSARSTPSSQSSPGTPGSTANGNKGHIQIEGAPDCGSNPCGEDNDPHLACTLTVQMFGYPAGTNDAALSISGQQPSGTGSVLSDSFSFQGASSPNGSILDTERTYSLTVAQLTAAGLIAEPQHGYHLRVQVAVNGDHAKTHVVWFQPCAPAPVPPGSSSGSPSTAGTSGSNTGTTGTPVASTGSGSGALVRGVPDASAGLAPDSSVAAQDSLPAALAAIRGSAALTGSPAEARRSGSLPFTGIDILYGLAAAAAATLLGAVLVGATRRSQSARPGI